MSGIFTRHFAVLNINGEHLVYRRDRDVGEGQLNAELIQEPVIFEDGAETAMQNPLEQANAVENVMADQDQQIRGDQADGYGAAMQNPDEEENAVGNQAEGGTIEHSVQVKKETDGK